MVLFFFGYLVSAYFVSAGKLEIIQTLTGVIFFLGSVFVMLVVVVGKGTIQELKETLVSKEEKETMLKEIHHRVKNNLQIIKSLLRLQSGYITDETVLKNFKDSENRILAMALVHEKLYKTKNLSAVNLSDYLTSLAISLSSVYEVNDEVSIRVNTSVDQFNMETIIPLGLLVNEIVANSFKHAFKESNEGEVFIELEKINGDFKLVVGDDGKGYPQENFQKENATLGLDLIKTLTHQLDGEIKKVESEKGVVYELIFKEQFSRPQKA